MSTPLASGFHGPEAHVVRRKHFACQGQPIRPARGALELAVALVAMALVLMATGATTALASSGYVYTHDEIALTDYTSTGQITLATTEFAPSVNVAAAPNPKVYWGDGSEEEAHSSLAGFNCDQCELRGAHTYTAPGTYNVTVVYNTGASVWYTTTFTIVVSEAEYTFASIGDSVASGEGNPNGSTGGALPQAIWSDGLGPTILQTYPAGTNPSPCHQSEHAPPTQLAQQFREETNRAVSYTQLACAGADVQEVIAKQVPQLGSRHITALTMTLGANNIDGGFANLIEKCLAEFGFCQENASFTKSVKENVEELPGLFEKLAKALGEHEISNVFISEYYDPTHNAGGTFGTYQSNYECTLEVLNPATWQWAYEDVLTPLNEAITEAAHRYGWHLVSGIASAFKQHGFCAWTSNEGQPDEAWVRAFTPGTSLNIGNLLTSVESLGIEQQVGGEAHPNEEGERVITEYIAESVYRELGAPQTELDGTLPYGKGFYDFGSGTTEQVGLSFRAQTALPTVSRIKATYYSINDAACSPQDLSACTKYNAQSPIGLHEPGIYNVKFFSENNRGLFETPKTEIVHIVAATRNSLPVSAEAVNHVSAADDGTYQFGSWTADDVVVTVGGSGSAAYGIDSGEFCNEPKPGECKEVSLPATFKFSAEGKHTIALRQGGSPTDVLPIDIERTPPTITFRGDSPAANGAGWNDKPVTLTWSCAASASPTIASSVTTAVSREGSGQPETGICSDQAGNSASDTQIVNVDEQPPGNVIVRTSRPPDEIATDGVPVFTAPFTVTAGAVDRLSGLHECTSVTYSGPAVTGDDLTGDCVDNAGNKVGWSYSFDYVVLPPQTIAFTSNAPSPGTVGESYSVSATGGGSGNPVTLAVATSSANVCTLTGRTIHFAHPGTCTINADQAGNSSYAPATQGQQSVNVEPAALTVIAPSPTYTNGETLPTQYTPTYNGFVDGETPANLTAQPTCQTTKTVTGPGSYTIVCRNGSSPNYRFDYRAGLLHVRPAPSEEDLYLLSAGARVSTHTPVTQRIQFDGRCELEAEGEVASTGKPTDTVTLKTPLRDECGLFYSISGSIGAESLSTAGKAVFKARPRIVFSEFGSCVYEYTKFEGSFKPQTITYVTATGVGRLNRAASSGLCEKTRAVEIGVEIYDRSSDYYFTTEIPSEPIAEF